MSVMATTTQCPGKRVAKEPWQRLGSWSLCASQAFFSATCGPLPVLAPTRCSVRRERTLSPSFMLAELRT